MSTGAFVYNRCRFSFTSSVKGSNGTIIYEIEFQRKFGEYKKLPNSSSKISADSMQVFLDLR